MWIKTELSVLILVVLIQSGVSLSDFEYPFGKLVLPEPVNVTWKRGLVDAKALHLFLLGKDWFGREAVFAHKTRIEMAFVNSMFPYFTFVDMVSSAATRFDRKILIDVSQLEMVDHFGSPGCEEFRKVPFIYYHFSLAYGPMGVEAAISLPELVGHWYIDWPISLSVGWTYEYPTEAFAPLGYTSDHVRNMRNVIESAPFRSLEMIEIDAVHGSHSTELLAEFYNVSRYVLIKTLDMTNETALRVNVPELRKMMAKMGLERIYLDINDWLRAQLLKPDEERKDDTSSVQRCKLFMSFSLLLLVFDFLLYFEFYYKL